MHMSEIVAGIDLGTSNSVISVVLEGEAIVIPDAQGRRVHPSIVHLMTGGQAIVGNDARPYRLSDPMNTVFSAKRLIGRPYDSPEIKMLMGLFPFPIIPAEDNTPRIQVQQQLHPPEGIGARVLHYLKGLAEDYLGQPVTRAVITVPANFDEAQRRATKRAGELAGLEVLRLINEPTAAALAYGYGSDRRERVAIYDFGGGTFDVTLLELRGNVFEVLSTAGNSYLGGDDFDFRLVSAILNAFERQHHVDLSADDLVRQRLRVYAEEIKKGLSQQDAVRMMIRETIPGTVTELELDFSLTRDNFEKRCADIVDQSLTTCEDALRSAGLQRAEIDHLVLVGGSTRVPLVQRRAREFFNREPVLGIDPDEVVAVGAAVFGASMVQEQAAPAPMPAIPALAGFEEGIEELDESWLEEIDAVEQGAQAGPLLIDVTPHALGVATVGGVMDIIIERNGQLPLERSRYFSTSRDDQTRVVLPIYSGNSRRIEDNQQLGVLELTDIPPGPREEVQIEVTFEVDTNGMLSVRATDMRTGFNQFAQLSISGDSQIHDYDASNLLM
ncbi:molecular chaperone DnaK [Bradymonadaceae bacterium TMQ3]|nr:molecular chaperone DnaK [Bradymonadaceae bacterium TMQ3]TXC78218.1 Hsp70 family protein [Bradymonadales bacterium TMQ1]